MISRVDGVTPFDAIHFRSVHECLGSSSPDRLIPPHKSEFQRWPRLASVSSSQPVP
jgi:hypothetical protein